MSIRYPVYRPSLGDLEKRYVMDCLDTTWISSKGAYIEKFETGFAAFTGNAHAQAVSNGTVALHVALVALGIGPGDEVIVPSFTYVASANAIAHTGATPVFCDCDPVYWQMDVEDAARRITPRTRAIMPVHLYGHACDMDAVMALAKAHNLKVIEDCAEALGTTWNGQHVGTFGDLGTFSFFGNKTLTTGEGGMVVTNDAALSAAVHKLKGQGLAGTREYFHDVLGFNYRMTNICAAIGAAQLQSLPQTIEKKRQLADWYRTALDGLPLHVQPEAPGCVHSYWMVTIATDAAEDRIPLREALRTDGIETRPAFIPMHEMPMYAMPGDSFPNTCHISKRGINLPSYPDLSQEDIAAIGQAVQAFFRQERGKA